MAKNEEVDMEFISLDIINSRTGYKVQTIMLIKIIAHPINIQLRQRYGCHGKTGHRPGTTPQQWAMARVNSMLTGGKADPDLQPKARGRKEQRRHQKSQNSLVVFRVV